MTAGRTSSRRRDAAAWIDENPDITWRNQFVFNLAETACENGRFHARWKGQEVRVLHFNGRGRSCDSRYRGLFAQGRPAGPFR